MDSIKLAEIQPVVLVVETADGEIHTVDPFEVARKLEPVLSQDDLTATQGLDQIGAAFGIPGLTDQQAVFLLKKVVELVKMEVQSKEDGPTMPT
jgi:hypothetical protein